MADKVGRRRADARVGGLLVAALILALAAVVGLFLKRSGAFVWDDFANLRVAQVEGLSVRYLLRPVLLQFAPGHKLVMGMLSLAAPPLPYRAVIVMTVTLFGAGVAATYRLLVVLYGRTPLNLVLTAVYGGSVIQLGTGIWLAGALHRLPGMVFALASVLAYLRFRSSGQRGALAASVVLLALGLAFMVQAAFVVVFVIVFEALVLGPRDGAWARLRAASPSWAWYLIPAVVVMLGYLTQLTGALDLSSPSAAVRYLGVSWAQVFVPSLVGLYVGDDAVTALDGLVMVVSQAALALAVVASIRRRRDAWRPWVAFIIGFGLIEGSVALTRLAGFDPAEVAFGMRYHIEALAAFVVAAGAAFGGVPDRPADADRGPDADPAARAGPPARQHGAGTDRAWAVAAAAAVAFVGLSAVGQARLADGWIGGESGAFIDRLHGELVAAKAVVGVPSLVDGDVPYEVAPAELFPYNRLSAIVPLVAAGIAFDLTSPDLFAVTADGRLQPVSYRPFTGGTAPGLAASGQLNVAFATSVTTVDGELCIAGGAAGPVFSLPAPAAPSGDIFLRFRYRTDGRRNASVVHGTGTEASRADDPFVELSAGGGEAMARITSEPLAYAAVALPPRATVCIGDIDLGVVVGR